MTAKPSAREFWAGQTVLLTGGTGSFGQKFAEVLLEHCGPKELIVYSRDELKQYEMAQQFAGRYESPVRFVLGDVRDKERLRRAMRGVTVVVHAAAMKQIPACEIHPTEAVLTNVIGTMNIIEASLDVGVPRVMEISTDKAVRAVSLYGATKFVAEKLFVSANDDAGPEGPRFSCVRYGNVVGSRGGVVDLFKKQREAGRLTITDPRMSRFWIALDEGVRTVIRCIEEMKGGEIFVPKIPSMRITDLAEVIAPGVDIEYIGIRPGDKLSELLLAAEEARDAVELDDLFVILPPDAPRLREHWTVEGRQVPEGFEYTSSTNRQLSHPELAEMLEHAP